MITNTVPERLRLLACIGSLAACLSTACGDEGSAGGAEDVDGGAAAGATGVAVDATGGAGGEPVVVPPPRVSTHPLCVFSADCPDGQHCDLGECVQDCNEESACETGSTCSARARCLAPGEEDKDPDPVTERVGSVTAEPLSALLTDGDDTLSVRLQSDSDEPVRYRVALRAPHLAIDEVRGEFERETTLTFNVTTAGLQGHNVPGTIRIFTNLGNVVVDAPIKVGLTGTYQGALSYNGSALPLGSTQVVVDMVENNGDVTVQVDPERSLLFPESEAGPMAGRGVFTFTDGVQFSLKQVLSSQFGGTSNHFARSVGRDIRFQLHPSDRGTLEGMFEETIHGLFEQPITLRGSVYLEHEPLEREPVLTVPPDPVMPTASATTSPDVGAVFPGWTQAGCWNDAAVASACPYDTVLCAGAIDWRFYAPLELRLSGGILSPRTESVGTIADLCALDMLRTANHVDVPACALVPPLACALRQIDITDETSPAAAEAFSRLYAHTLNPALLVAQNNIVEGLRESFLEGLQEELTQLESARAVLKAPATWVLHPSLLDYLSRTAELVPAPSTDPPAHHTALRTLARLFYVLSTIDGETSHLAAANRVDEHSDLVRAAQERGVLTLLEAATIIGILDAWGEAAPPGVGTEFTGVLTPMDQGFASLVQGALLFGVPEGFIPFTDEREAEETNFERVMASQAAKFPQQAEDEAAFVNATRDFEQMQDRLTEELEGIRLSLESQVTDICGSGFDVTMVESDADWEACGSGGGDVAALRLNMDQARERLLAAENRIAGMGDRIEIEQNRLDEVQDVRDGTIRFVDQTGEQLQAIVYAEGVINSVQIMLELSSNSSLMNFGASAGMGAAAAMFEAQRTLLNAERQELQTAQEVRIHADNARVEVINGMAVIKGLMVDMAQLRVEMRQDVLGQLQAELDIRNALDRAKRLAGDRTAVLARVAASSFNDPSFRVLQTRSAIQAIRSRAEAQRALFLAGRALEYHLNQPLGDALGEAVLNAHNQEGIGRLQGCLESIYGDSTIWLDAPQDYATEFSVRERLGIHETRVDEVTGEELSPAEQFRHFLLRNENLDGRGGVGLEFSSNLEPGNGLWPSNVCDDKITTVEAQLVGDFLGDNDAQVELSLEGGGVLRRCDRELVNWSTDGTAVIQAGVNTFGTASPNTSLAGLSVASANWRVVIPGPTTAPSNADLDLEKVDDIVLRVRHAARPTQAAATSMSFACLGTVGAGL